MKDAASPEAASNLALVVSDVYRALPLFELATRQHILWQAGKLCSCLRELEKLAPLLHFLLRVVKGSFTKKEPHLAGKMSYTSLVVILSQIY